MKKVFSLLLVLCLVLACTSAALAEEKNALTVAASAEPTRFFASGKDGSNNNDYAVLYNLYDTLVVLDAQGNIVPSLATGYTVSDDGLCYTFTLREGVKFHNGAVMTAQDVAFSLDVSSKIASGKALLINYDHSEVVDDLTVNVYLSAPYAAFINGIASRVGMIFNKAYYEEVGEEGYLKNPIGTGAYTLVSAVSGDTITLEAFPDYWAGVAPIKTVNIKTMTDSSTQAIALENGDVDLILSPSISTCTTLDTSKGVNWTSGSSAGRVTMHITSNEGSPSHDNINFRKAVQAAVNKEDVVLGAVDGYAEIINIDMCPSYSGHPEGYDVVAYDVEKAKEYLAASNYDGSEFQILVQAGTTYDTVAQIIQAQLMEIGINCTVNAVDTSTFTDLWYAGKYGAMIRNTNSSLMDADGFLNFFMATDYAPTNNNQHPRTKEIYELGMAARAAQGDARKELYLKAVNIVTEEAYEVPLFASTNTLAFNSNLNGVVVHPLNIVCFYNLAWK